MVVGDECVWLVLVVVVVHIKLILLTVFDVCRYHVLRVFGSKLVIEESLDVNGTDFVDFGRHRVFWFIQSLLVSFYLSSDSFIIIPV